MKLLKETELLNQAATISSKIEKEEIFSFFEENDIFGDAECNF
jgi:heat shock protein HslJ